MTDITCRFIVQKGRQFLMTEMRGRAVFSQYVYDAKAYHHEEDARNAAKAVGGRVRIFDALNYELT